MEVGEPVASVPAGEAPETVARIVSVAFLDGDDATELAGPAKHFVNLPRDARWVDGTHVTTIDRLTQKTRFKVRFDQPGTHTFKVKYAQGPNNIAYSTPEKNRNENFKHQDQERTYTTASDGTKIIRNEYFVSAGSVNEWHLVAKDNQGNEVRSTSLTTHKLVYYVEVKMTGLASVANSLAVMTAEHSRHNIALVGLPSVNMPHFANLTDANMPQFLNSARTAYNGSQGPTKAPYAVAIVYTDHIADRESDKEVSKPNVPVGPGMPDVTVDIVDPTNSQRRYLWHKIVQNEGWFVSCTFLPSGGTPGQHEVQLAEADCTRVPGTTIPDRSSQVTVRVSGLPPGTGTLTLKVNWVKRMRSGVSMSGNIVLICTRSYWAPLSTVQQNEVMVHELGHQFEMVADGTGTGPDKVPTQFSGRGFFGSHCFDGLPDQPDYTNATGGTCVMFAKTNNISTYCANCTPAVRKQDFSRGFTAF
jgi:hypothetical protein